MGYERVSAGDPQLERVERAEARRTNGSTVPMGLEARLASAAAEQEPGDVPVQERLRERSAAAGPGKVSVQPPENVVGTVPIEQDRPSDEVIGSCLRAGGAASLCVGVRSDGRSDHDGGRGRHDGGDETTAKHVNLGMK
jgi:hypothetical protein